jgi:hypothetical protein
MEEAMARKKAAAILHEDQTEMARARVIRVWNTLYAYRDAA